LVNNVDETREFYARTIVPGNGKPNGWLHIRLFDVPTEWKTPFAGKTVFDFSLTEGGYGCDGEGDLSLEKMKELRDWLSRRIVEQEGKR